MRNVIETSVAPAPVGPYSQAIAAQGRMVFVSGQIALDAKTGAIVGGDDVAQQTQQVLANLQSILDAAGATFNDVVKTTVFLADMNDFAIVNDVYGKAFGEESPPARACMEVARLPKDVRVEIECIAVMS